MECIVSREDEDTYLRDVYTTAAAKETQIRILAHASVQFYRVVDGAWHAQSGGIVGLVAFGKHMDDLHVGVLSITDFSLMFDKPISTIQEYTVRTNLE